VTRHYASKEDPVPLEVSSPRRHDLTSPRQGVTENPVASSSGQEGERWQEWRVLRFNEETVQSVARTEVVVEGDGGEVVVQRGDCMAFLYMKTLAAAGKSLKDVDDEW